LFEDFDFILKERGFTGQQKDSDFARMGRARVHSCRWVLENSLRFSAWGGQFASSPIFSLARSAAPFRSV